MMFLFDFSKSIVAFLLQLMIVLAQKSTLCDSTFSVSFSLFIAQKFFVFQQQVAFKKYLNLQKKPLKTLL